MGRSGSYVVSGCSRTVTDVSSSSVGPPEGGHYVRTVTLHDLSQAGVTRPTGQLTPVPPRPQ
jgi:hypothetical protein